MVTRLAVHVAPGKDREGVGDHVNLLPSSDTHSHRPNTRADRRLSHTHGRMRELSQVTRNDICMWTEKRFRDQISFHFRSTMRSS